jgi:integrase
MANRPGRRRFGNIRKRPSGRWQASYIAPDGLRRYAGGTFDRKGDAERWLSVVESEILRGEWLDPLLSAVSVEEYASAWIKERQLRPRTRENYQDAWRLHIKPFLGSKQLRDITPQVVREWRTRLLETGRGEPTVAKAYRLLRAVLNTAVDDGLISRNPCRIKGADRTRTPERPVATVPQVYALADAVGARFRALILLAAVSGLRWAELVGLRRADLDLDSSTLRVPRRVAELRNGGMEEGPTKTAAGLRTVALPEVVVTELQNHLGTFVGPEDTALLFIGAQGGRLRRGNFRRAVKWVDARVAAGLPEGFHFHDLRHTGDHLASRAGASTRELMYRMGHASEQAALIYQHATRERDRQIAEDMDRMIQREARRSVGQRRRQSGTKTMGTKARQRTTGSPNSPLIAQDPALSDDPAD